MFLGIQKFYSLEEQFKELVKKDDGLLISKLKLMKLNEILPPIIL